MDICLPRFDIYQEMIDTNCFKSYASSWCLGFLEKKFFLRSGLKFTLSDVTTFLPENLSGLKKNILRSDMRSQSPLKRIEESLKMIEELNARIQDPETWEYPTERSQDPKTRNLSNPWRNLLKWAMNFFFLTDTKDPELHKEDLFST